MILCLKIHRIYTVIALCEGNAFYRYSSKTISDKDLKLLLNNVLCQLGGSSNLIKPKGPEASFYQLLSIKVSQAQDNLFVRRRIEIGMEASTLVIGHCHSKYVFIDHISSVKGGIEKLFFFTNVVGILKTFIALQSPL